MKLYPETLTSLYIEWTLEGDEFTLLRSTSPNSGFDIVAQQITQPFYVDAVSLYDDNIRYYYKVEGYSAGNKVAEDGPATLQYNKPDNVAHKVIHEAKVVLRVMKNPPVYFLLKRRVGNPCPECWNPVTRRVKYAGCPVCNGTGTVQGYHDPIATRISQDVSQLVMASGDFDGDKAKLTPIRAWIGNTPLLTPEDIMVDVMDQRYKVVNVGRRTKSQYVIRQVIDLVPLEKGHPAYNLAVDRSVTP